MLRLLLWGPHIKATHVKIIVTITFPFLSVNIKLEKMDAEMHSFRMLIWQIIFFQNYTNISS